MTVTATPVASPDPDALSPVQAALLALARRDADQVLASADAEAAAALAQADTEVAQITAAARAEAANDAAELLAADRARADREARSVELRARRAAYDELVRRAHAAMRELGDDPDVRARLVGLARARLGPAATVGTGPDGGAVAEVEGRQVTFALSALADQAVAELLAEQEER